MIPLSFLGIQSTEKLWQKVREFTNIAGKKIYISIVMSYM